MYLETNTGLVVQELRNGFLGHEAVYLLFHGKNLIAFSIDKKNWTMSSWITKIKLKQIDENMFKQLSMMKDV